MRLCDRKKITLPFDDHPIPSMYHNLAFPMGIIQGNAKEDIAAWLCGKFFNCFFMHTAILERTKFCSSKM